MADLWNAELSAWEPREAKLLRGTLALSSATAAWSEALYTAVDEVNNHFVPMLHTHGSAKIENAMLDEFCCDVNWSSFELHDIDNAMTNFGTGKKVG